MFHAYLCVSSVNHPAASESPAVYELRSIKVPRQAGGRVHGGGVVFLIKAFKEQKRGETDKRRRGAAEVSFFSDQFRFLQLVTLLVTAVRMEKRVWPGVKWTQVM